MDFIKNIHDEGKYAMKCNKFSDLEIHETHRF